MKNSVDPGTSGELRRVHLVSGTLNALLEVYSELLDHPENNTCSALNTSALCDIVRALEIHLLQQSLGLSCRVIRAEVFILFNLLLQGEELRLELAAQAGQRISYVVGQLLKK